MCFSKINEISLLILCISSNHAKEMQDSQLDLESEFHVFVECQEYPEQMTSDPKSACDDGKRRDSICQVTDADPELMQCKCSERPFLSIVITDCIWQVLQQVTTTEIPTVTTQPVTTQSIPLSCPKIIAPKNGSVLCDKYSCVITCKQGYIPSSLLNSEGKTISNIQSSRFQCENGQWGAPFGELITACEPISNICAYDPDKIDDLKTFRAGAYVQAPSGSFLGGTIVKIFCNSGHVFEHNNKNKVTMKCSCDYDELNKYYRCTNRLRYSNFGICRDPNIVSQQEMGYLQYVGQTFATFLEAKTLEVKTYLDLLEQVTAESIARARSTGYELGILATSQYEPLIQQSPDMVMFQRKFLDMSVR